MNLEYEVVIKGKEAEIAKLDTEIANHENAALELRAKRDVAKADLETLCRIRDEQIAAESASRRTQYTIGDAAVAILTQTGNAMHADQILPLLATYGVAASKPTLVSQLLRDDRFENQGRNIFNLRNGQSPPSPTEADDQPAVGQNVLQSEETPLIERPRVTEASNAEKGASCLRSIGEPLTTSELMAAMVQRGILKDSKNLFQTLHTGLKRRPDILFLGADRRWRLTEWESAKQAEQSSE